MPFPTNLLCVGSVCGLGPDLLGIHTLSLAARYRTAANSNTLTKGLEKIEAARGYDLAPFFALSSDWEEKFLIPSMACSTVEAFDIVRRLEHSVKLDESPQEQKGCHSLASRQITAGPCRANFFTCLQNFSTGQSLSHCADLASQETCVACFSSWVHRWFLTHPLQWSVYGRKISRRGRRTDVSNWLPA